MSILSKLVNFLYTPSDGLASKARIFIYPCSHVLLMYDARQIFYFICATKMNDYNALLQTIAAICSAIAAIKAASLAKSTFAFQRNSLLKKANIEQILRLLYQLHHLKSLTYETAWNAEDKKIIELTSNIFELRKNVTILQCMIAGPASGDVIILRHLTNDLHENNIFACDDEIPNIAAARQLDDAINVLQNIYLIEMN